MAIISAKTAILFRACFLWSLGYMLVTSPNKVVHHPLVVILGQALGLPEVNIRKNNPLVGLLAVVLATSGLIDIPLLAVKGTSYLTVNSVVIPIRLIIFFLVTSWCYLTKNPYLSNALVFAYGFAEIVINFGIYVVIREENNELAGEEVRRRHAD